MRRWIVLASFSFVAVVGSLAPLTSAQTTSLSATSFSGTWTLNRTLSQIPKEMGFNVIDVPVTPNGGQGGPGGGGGRGGRGRGGGGGGSQPGSPSGAFARPRESYDDSQRRELLTSEARNPFAGIEIKESPGLLTIVDDQGGTRALPTTGSRQSIELQNIPVMVSASNSQGRYLVTYEVSTERSVRYMYTRHDNPLQVIVDIDLIERNKVGDQAHLVYEPGTLAPKPSAAPVTSTASTSAAPAATGRPAEIFDQRPGAELRGLKSLGVVVEDLSAMAKSCGLDQSAIDAAVSKRLTAGGFTVRRNSDSDTYLYVNIKSDRLPDGTCVSRYDQTIYSHTTAKMSYGASAALVQVELMHRGGLSAGAGQQGPSIIRQLEGDIDLFAQQIHSANQ